MSIAELAQSLLNAADGPHHHPRPLLEGNPLSVSHGRDIQHAQLALRQHRGESLVGVKLGLTTQAQRDDAGVDYSSVGYLTDEMVVTERIERSRSVAPKVEPEMVAVFDSTVENPEVTDAEIVAAIGSLRAGIEIVDPRYESPHFVLPDALADNSSARGAAWSPTGLRPDQFDPAAETVVLEAGGHPALEGHASIILGNPLRVVIEVVRERLQRGVPTPAGFVIFTGNLAGQALPVEPGEKVVATFAHLGRIELDVVD